MSTGFTNGELSASAMSSRNSFAATSSHTTVVAEAEPFAAPAMASLLLLLLLLLLFLVADVLVVLLLLNLSAGVDMVCWWCLLLVRWRAAWFGLVGWRFPNAVLLAFFVWTCLCETGKW